MSWDKSICAQLLLFRQVKLTKMILKSYLLLLVKAQELNPECEYLSVAEECANDCEIIFGQCLVECQLDPACITECARADYEVNFSMVAEKSKDEVSQYLIKSQ